MVDREALNPKFILISKKIFGRTFLSYVAKLAPKTFDIFSASFLAIFSKHLQLCVWYNLDAWLGVTLLIFAKIHEKTFKGKSLEI